MNLTLRHVKQDFIAQTWPLVEGFIASAVEKGDAQDYGADQIKVYLTTGQWILLVATDEGGTIHGAATLSFINYPNYRVAFVTSTGGKLICNDDTLAQLKKIAYHFGATKIQAGARESVVRLLQRLGFKERYTVIETSI